MSKIIVKVTTGQELLWRSIKIKKSLDEICHTLELEIPPSERLKVKRHNKIQVSVDNPIIRKSGWADLITTVLVDEVTSNADVTKNSLMVIGRSPARDIIDSTWSDTCANHNPDGSSGGMKLRKIIQVIGDKFGITCDTYPTGNLDDPTEEVYDFEWNNESPWTKLISEADNQKKYKIITSNQRGHLYLWYVTSGVNREGFHITEGVNIKNIKWTQNGSEQFHEYIVIGEDCEERIFDNDCPNGRVLTLDLSDTSIRGEAVRRRAETERRRRSENKVTVTVSGWGLTDEQMKRLGSMDRPELFWFPNSIIPVSIPSLGLEDKLLISEVEYTATADAISCDITLTKREAYL